MPGVASEVTEEYRGVIKSYHGGYGFIVSDEFPDLRFFVCHEPIQEHWCDPGSYLYAMPGEEVRFSWIDTPKGPRATRVEIISIRDTLQACVISRPTPNDVCVDFAWQGNVYRRNIVMKHIIPGLGEFQPRHLEVGDWIIAVAYTDINGGVRIGHGVASFRPPLASDEARRRTKPTIERKESKIVRIDGWDVVAGPASNPNRIIPNLGRVADEHHTTIRSTTMYKIGTRWYATMIVHPPR